MLQELVQIYIRNNNVAEFENDLQRFQFVSKLILKYVKHGEINVRLLFNHMIILFNVFGENTTEALYELIDDEYHVHINTILFAMQRGTPPIDEDFLKILEKGLQNE